MTSTDLAHAPPLADLSARLGGSSLITEPDVMEAYRRDAANLVAPGRPLAVLLARSTADVSVALQWAGEHRIPVVPRGGGSGLSGGAAAIDGCLVLSTVKMDQIQEISAADQLAVVQAGVINADLGRAAREFGLMYAPDPSSFEISTIGGNLATNAGGLRCVKYGVTRESVLALEAVMADGRIVTTGHRTVKGVSGYDLTSLFVGSEGTLAVITGATVKLRPLPATEPVTVVGSFARMPDAAAAVAACVLQGLSPSLLELLDRATLTAIDEWKNMGLRDTGAMLIAQADGTDAEHLAGRLASAFTEAGAGFVAVSSDPAEARMLLEVRRLAYPAAERLGTCLVEDVGVPRSRLADLLEVIEGVADEYQVRIMTVAHAGDGNVHPTFVFDPGPDGDAPPAVWTAADAIFRAALSMGGTLTGEHGVGVLKRRWLAVELGDTVLDIHRSIKAALDPLDILNPGRAF